MSVAPFFERVVTAIGRHLMIDRMALEQRLAPVAPGVECSPPGTAGAWTDELLANLFARLYPRLVFFGDDRTAATCWTLARSVNPNVELSEEPEVATLVVSTAARSTTPTTLIAGSRGWTAYLAGSVPPDARAQPVVFAAAAAAALAARAMFRRLVLQIDAAEDPVRWNLLSLRNDADYGVMAGTEEVDLGHVLVAGVGAVGNAAIWCLRRHAGLRGDARVIDPETVDLANLQRYVLAAYGDVGLAKTSLAERELEGTGVHVRRIDGRLGDAAIPEDIERILVTVDNVEARRIAQSLLPLLVVNGWTSETGLGASWHDFTMGRGCLACLYHPTAPVPSEIEIVAKEIGLPPARAGHLLLTGAPLTNADLISIAPHLGRPVAELEEWGGRPLRECHRSLICGGQAAPLGRDDANVVVPLAHQSVLAGVLAASELVKRASSTLAAVASNDHVLAWEDLGRPRPTTWTRRIGHAKGCICRDRDYREVYRRKWPSLATPSGDVSESG